MSSAGLSIQGISLRLGATDILTDVHLDVPPGSRHVIIGHNGAGKSSLLNVIAGTIRPTHGRILLHTTDITGWPPHRIARTGVARTWQHPALCEHLTVADNLALATRRRSHRHNLPTLIEQADLGDHASTRIADLSYGLRRRVEIAVAMAANPRLLLLDEPSAGLSSAGLAVLIAQLTRLAPSTTVLMTDHNLDVVDAIAQHLTVLHHGKVLATGPADQTRINAAAFAQPAQSQPHAPSRKALANIGDVVLTVRRLTVSFQGTPVIRDIRLDLQRGDIYGVTGGNGAGKSTLLRAIAGLTPAHPEARIILAGNAIHDLPTARRVRHGLAIVTQERGIFTDLTVAENLRIARAASIAGHAAQNAFPALDLRLNHKAGNLSGGEQQMLAIKRVLATRPQVLLLDEPFEGLAAPAATQLRDIIKALADNGAAILLAEHSANLPTELCTRVVAISGNAGFE